MFVQCGRNSKCPHLLLLIAAKIESTTSQNPFEWGSESAEKLKQSGTQSLGKTKPTTVYVAEVGNPYLMGLDSAKKLKEGSQNDDDDDDDDDQKKESTAELGPNNVSFFSGDDFVSWNVKRELSFTEGKKKEGQPLYASFFKGSGKMIESKIPGIVLIFGNEKWIPEGEQPSSCRWDPHIKALQQNPKLAEKHGVLHVFKLRNQLKQESEKKSYHLGKNKKPFFGFVLSVPPNDHDNAMKTIQDFIDKLHDDQNEEYEECFQGYKKPPKFYLHNYMKYEIDNPETKQDFHPVMKMMSCNNIFQVWQAMKLDPDAILGKASLKLPSSKDIMKLFFGFDWKEEHLKKIKDTWEKMKNAKKNPLIPGL